MFTFKGWEKDSLIRALDRGSLGPTHFSQVLDHLFNSPGWYEYCFTSYVKEIEKDQKAFNWVKDIVKESSLYDSLVRNNMEFLIVHMLEMPLPEVPLYLNAQPFFVRIIAKWRLEIGR